MLHVIFIRSVHNVCFSKSNGDLKDATADMSAVKREREIVMLQVHGTFTQFSETYF